MRAHPSSGRRSLLRPLGLAGAGLFALVAGCELIVPGSLSNVHCKEEGAIGPPVCPVGTFCRNGLCEDGPPGLGEPCAGGAMCGPDDLCLDPSRIGFSGEPFCSATCCSSADCGVGTGLVCAALGPGKICVPADLWGRARPGARFGGDACEKDGDCRSGECDVDDGYCVDTCCSDAECAVYGATCRAGDQGWTCEPDPGAVAKFPAPCERDSDCASDLCVMWSDGALRCGDPCCSSAECGKVKVGDVVKPLLCTSVAHGSAQMLACAAVGEGPGNRAVGEPCDDAGECRGGLCIDTASPQTPPGVAQGNAPAKACSDVCCTDASCGAPHLFACRPAKLAVDPAAPAGSGGQGFDLQCRGR